MYDQCTDMYVMIPPSDDGASAGKGFMPFLKRCSTYFSLRGGGVFSYRLGHFLREGMKPSPAPGKCDQCLNMIFDFICGIRVGINPTPTVDHGGNG